MSRITPADFFLIHFTPYQWALLAFLLALYQHSGHYDNTEVAMSVRQKTPCFQPIVNFRG
jgi:hypothetical protein